VGDYVAYSYKGVLLDQEVTIGEQVLAVDGDRLTLLVQARRGEDRMRWIQVVRDRDDPRAPPDVEGVYRIKGDDLEVLDASAREALLEVYDWVLPPRGEGLREVRKRLETVTVGQTEYEANCFDAEQALDGETIAFTACISDGFLWRNLYVRLVSATETLLYEAKVVESARKPTPADVPALP
jgi:hypothetical protein